MKLTETENGNVSTNKLKMHIQIPDNYTTESTLEKHFVNDYKVAN